MIRILDLLERNRKWATGCVESDPDYFQRLVSQQAPKFLWIGCSDSRVPANQIVGIEPGEMFVHRNIANVVVHTDLNCLSVLQYAIEVLGVEHIIVCGHYGCGGIRAAFQNQPLGLIDNWLRNIRDVHHRYETEMRALPSDEARIDRLCELNVIQQVSNVAHTTIVQDAWRSGRQLIVHGWIYRLTDGIIHDLEVSVRHPDALSGAYRMEG